MNKHEWTYIPILRDFDYCVHCGLRRYEGQYDYVYRWYGDENTETVTMPICSDERRNLLVVTQVLMD